jgi:hypothetical protein
MNVKKENKMKVTYHFTSGNGNPSTLQSNLASPFSGARISDIRRMKLGRLAAVKHRNIWSG